MGEHCRKHQQSLLAPHLVWRRAVGLNYVIRFVRMAGCRFPLHRAAASSRFVLDPWRSVRLVMRFDQIPPTPGHAQLLYGRCYRAIPEVDGNNIFRDAPICSLTHGEADAFKVLVTVLTDSLCRTQRPDLGSSGF